MAIPTMPILTTPINNAGSGSKHQLTHMPSNNILLTDYPAATDLRYGVTCANGSITGNMTEPPSTKVENGFQYGANGTEFTGTYAGGGKKNFGFNF